MLMVVAGSDVIGYDALMKVVMVEALVVVGVVVMVVVVVSDVER